MPRFISNESAIAFDGTEHEHHIMDQETREAYDADMGQSQVDVFLEAGDVAVTGNAIEATIDDAASEADTGDIHQTVNDPFDEGYVPSEDSDTTAVAALESIIEDLEGVSLRTPENVPKDKPDVEFDVKVELDEPSKTELDNDIQTVIDKEPLLCESLESIILCGEKDVATLLSILRNKVESIKSDS